MVESEGPESDGFRSMVFAVVLGGRELRQENGVFGARRAEIGDELAVAAFALDEGGRGGHVAEVAIDLGHTTHVYKPC